jgi:hypothetical protein
VALSLSESIEIQASPEIVFRALSTPERLPEWNVSIEQARRVGSDPVGLGSRAVCGGRLFGQPLESETEVAIFEPPSRFATRAVRGPRLHTRFSLEPVGLGTRLGVHVTGEVPGGLVGGFIAERMLRSELGASLQRLRMLCEREAGTEASGR